MKVKTSGSGEEKGVKSALPLKFDHLGIDAIPHGTYHNPTYQPYYQTIHVIWHVTYTKEQDYDME